MKVHLVFFLVFLAYANVDASPDYNPVVAYIMDSMLGNMSPKKILETVRDKLLEGIEQIDKLLIELVNKITEFMTSQIKNDEPTDKGPKKSRSKRSENYDYLKLIDTEEYVNNTIDDGSSEGNDDNGSIKKNDDGNNYANDVGKSDGDNTNNDHGNHDNDDKNGGRKDYVIDDGNENYDKDYLINK